MMLRGLVATLLLLCAALAQAHDSRPNFVEIIETEPNVFSVQWKIPATVPDAALPTIRMPESCTTDARLAMQQSGRVALDELARAVRQEEGEQCPAAAGNDGGESHQAARVPEAAGRATPAGRSSRKCPWTRIARSTVRTSNSCGGSGSGRYPA